MWPFSRPWKLNPPVELPGPAPRAHEILFSPDGADLDEIASRCWGDAQVLLRIFTALTFTVGFLGFTPGFAYLYGLPPVLHLPRRPSPRTASLPPGSIALAGPYVGIYLVLDALAGGTSSARRRGACSTSGASRRFSCLPATR